jgi:hypothetical protein
LDRAEAALGDLDNNRDNRRRGGTRQHSAFGHARPRG